LGYQTQNLTCTCLCKLTGGTALWQTGECHQVTAHFRQNWTFSWDWNWDHQLLLWGPLPCRSKNTLQSTQDLIMLLAWHTNI